MTKPENETSIVHQITALINNKPGCMIKAIDILSHFDNWQYSLPESDQFGPMRITADSSTITKIKNAFILEGYRVLSFDAVRIPTCQFPVLADELQKRNINIIYACGRPDWTIIRIDREINDELKEVFNGCAR